MIQRMSLAVIMVMVLGGASFALANPDGIYLIHRAVNTAAAVISAPVQVAAQPAPQPAKDSGIFSDMTTSVNIAANTNQPESGQVNHAVVQASVNVQKGPMVASVSQVREYVATPGSDLAGGTQFQGTVSNSVTVAFNFTPDLGKNAFNGVAQVPSATPAAPSAR